MGLPVASRIITATVGIGKLPGERRETNICNVSFLLCNIELLRLPLIDRLTDVTCTILLSKQFTSGLLRGVDLLIVDSRNEEYATTT